MDGGSSPKVHTFRRRDALGGQLSGDSAQLLSSEDTAENLLDDGRSVGIGNEPFLFLTRELITRAWAWPDEGTLFLLNADAPPIMEAGLVNNLLLVSRKEGDAEDEVLGSG